jgi:N6-adenosine-specific RNA methylase IME4
MSKKKRFSIVCADCPWSFGDKLKHSEVKRGAAANYQTMSISEIMQLPVNSIADPDGAILCLWVPSSLIAEGVQTMQEWGFTVKSTYVWIKVKKEPLGILRKDHAKMVKQFFKEGTWDALHLPTIKDLATKALSQFSLTNLLSFGMGHTFRQTHEICLVGINNNKIYQQLQNKSQRSVCFAPNLKHSAKPEELQDALDAMFPDANKIELFARRERKGWLCLGNEVGKKEDIRVSLDKLI